MLRLVGIPRAEGILKKYPHRLSGGMQQRAMIAMALSCNPNLLIADEPTTALDVTIQDQILDLMKELQRKTDTAIIYISHDLGVIAEIAQHILVMYAGKVVENAGLESIFTEPLHPKEKPLLAEYSPGRLVACHLRTAQGCRLCEPAEIDTQPGK